MASGKNIKQFYLNQIKEILEKKNIPLNETKPSLCISDNPSDKVCPNILSKKQDVEVVVFKEPKGARKMTAAKQKPPSSNHNMNSDKDASLLQAKQLLKQIEFDVSSYGMKGFSLEEKRKLEQERAIKLGAKPRKQKYVNYKILMEKKKLEGSKKEKSAKKKKNTVFWRDSKTMHSGQIGRFKDGVLELSSKDMKGL